MALDSESTPRHWKDGAGGQRPWKTEGLSSRNVVTSSWVNDIRGTEQVHSSLTLSLLRHIVMS